jgi:UMF1 family MFS transporter
VACGVWRVVRGAKNIRTFLLAFFFYNMGVQTVMLMATPFGEKTLKLPSSSLIATILLLQLIGILGAYAFAYFSKKVGNKVAILTMLVIWLVVCVSAYFVYTEKQFYALAALVGLVMGGTQSLSRSTYSKLVPEDTQDTASFFSFYDICEKISIVLGMASFGLIVQFTGSMRNSTFALTLFFVLGIIVLSQLRRKW